MKSTSRFRTQSLTVAALALSAFAVAAVAQGPGSPMPNYPFSSFRFNFIYPGARATGMGQAFLAVSDDATGSETNPAGLTSLLTPQVFAEGRWVSNTFRTLNPTSGAIRYDDFRAGQFSPTFVSVVVPAKKWAFGLYRQELANYSVAPHQRTVEVPGVEFLLTPQPSPVNVNEFQAAVDINVVNYGVSVARRFWGEKLNMGLSVRATRFASSTLETQPASILSPEYEVPPGADSAVFERTDGVAWDWSWTGGVIVKPVEWLKVGGVFRSGSGHDYRAVFNENISSAITGKSIRSEIPFFEIRVPDRFGVGVAVLPGDRWTVTFDAVRIRYGQMTAPFVDYIQEEFRDDYGFHDGTGIHAGVEYTFFWKNVPISLRGGFYTEPDNSLHFLGDRLENDVIYLPFTPKAVPIGVVFRNFPVFQAALFPEAGTDYHKTFGAGVSVKTHLQLEFAADFGRDRGYVVLSLLYNY